MDRPLGQTRTCSFGIVTQPEKCSLTAKHAKHAKKEPLIPGVPELPRLSSPDDFRPWSESGFSDPGSLCALCELGGEIFRLSNQSAIGAVPFRTPHSASTSDVGLWT